MIASQFTRSQFAQRRDRIVELHRRGTGGIRVALALTELHDALLRSVYASIPPSDRRLFAVVALGGYGRRELCFASDIDIMLLVREDTPAEASKTAVQAYLHLLLDHGLNVGHSVRTVRECLDTAAGDVESWMSLLECRLVAGPSPLYSALRRALTAFIRRSDHGAFVRRLQGLLERRHAKYGTSTKLLEPNIKNSSGGLRDVHSAYWMLRGTGVLPSGASGATTATQSLLNATALKSLLRPDRIRELRSAVDLLLRVRNEMHLLSGALNDTLAFSFQPKVAAGLRYRQRDRRSTVERFMQDYYVAARRVAWLAMRVQSWAADRWLRPAGWAERRRLDADFELHHAKVHPRRRVRRMTNEYALRAFLHQAEHAAEFSFGLEDAIHRNEHAFRPLKTAPEQELWQRLFRSSSGVGLALQRMNALGLLARWIPEWRPLVAFFQHNQYHFYTADEHTLLVVANAEVLRTSSGTLSDVFRALPRTDILYWACLLHDIAKPVRLSTHEVAGVPMVRAVLGRLGAKDIADDVAFLVRHHLLMEQVAFRRNLGDPQTILEFAQRFPDARLLDYLFVLTHADLSAVNRNVLTEWKSSLLHELYRKAREVIESRLTHEDIRARSLEQRSEAERLVLRELRAEFPEQFLRDHLALIEDPSYVTTFPPAEIGEHVRIVGRKPLVHAAFRDSGDVTELTIVARDAPYALARFCGVLSANDATILDAGIFTRRDGIIIDRFRVADFVTRSVLGADQCGRIRDELEDVMGGRTDLRSLLERHQAKWKRRSASSNPNVRLDVVFEEHPRFTIVDVYAADTLGFLYRLTDGVSRLGLNIAFAKIATRADGIVDSFYVTESDGKRITSASRLNEVRRELLQIVRETAETELVVG